MAASIVHAAGESSDRVPKGTNAVVLAVPSEEALVALATELEHKKIPITVIVEDDSTTMAIGIEPVSDRREVRRLLSSLPLLR